MKQFFFFAISIFAAVVAGGYLLWLVMRAFGSVIDDWREGRESKQVRAEKQAMLEKKRLENQQRLDNGCEHNFDESYGAFPPGVCCKCGNEQKKPTGHCDHLWKKIVGPVPSSTCEKCGKKHGPLSVTQ